MYARSFASEFSVAGTRAQLGKRTNLEHSLPRGCGNTGKCIVHNWPVLSTCTADMETKSSDAVKATSAARGAAIEEITRAEAVRLCVSLPLLRRTRSTIPPLIPVEHNTSLLFHPPFAAPFYVHPNLHIPPGSIRTHHNPALHHNPHFAHLLYVPIPLPQQVLELLEIAGDTVQRLSTLDVDVDEFKALAQRYKDTLNEVKKTAHRHAGLLADNKPFGKSSYGAAKDIDLMNESQAYVDGEDNAQVKSHTGTAGASSGASSGSSAASSGLTPNGKRQKKR